MPKEYQVSDLFYASWKDLKPAVHEQVYTLQQMIKVQTPGSTEYGVNLIQILRALRKRPLLVDKMNVEQAVDVYNDLKFLNEPWYFFPKIDKTVITPDEHMARCSFDQFIYADNEFTSVIALPHQEQELRLRMARLAATLYLTEFDEYFDPETVADRAPRFLDEKVPLMLIFSTFAHMREFVVKRCKHLLPVGQSDEAAKPSGGMWHEIKHQAARTLVFGTFESLGRSNMYSVLDHLELLARDNVRAQDFAPQR
jgi:hypothetical protein